MSKKESMNADILQDILSEYGVEIRYNDLLHREDITDNNGVLDESETPLDTLIAYVCENYRDDYKYCTKEQIAQSLHRIAVKNRYNPIFEKIRRYTKNIREGDSYISKISHEIMRINPSDEFSHLLIKKDFLQSVAMLQNDPEVPYGADGTSVLYGRQGIGKTLYVQCRAIIPKYYRSIRLSPYQDEADLLSKANGVFVGEFSELEQSLKPTTVEMFKDFITASKDSYRPKYGRGVNDYIRRSTYICTCNTDSFLIDKTGNRRFWVIPCERPFDVDRLIRCINGEDDIFIKAYAEAYLYLQKHGMQSFRLSDAERKQLEERNKCFMCLSECESILKSILICSNLQEFTIAQLKDEYSELRCFDNARIGRILSRDLMIPQKMRKSRDEDGKRISERVYENTMRCPQEE